MRGAAVIQSFDKKPTAKTGARAKSTGSTPPATAGTPRRRTT